jgi:quinoprotein glucose dehydrogenase
LILHPRRPPRIVAKLGAALILAAHVALVAPATRAEDAPNDPVSSAARLAAAAIRVPAGYRVAPVVSEPHLANPVAFCFDGAGRIFVAETFRVRKGVEDNRNHLDWIDDDLAARTVADRRAYTMRHMGDRIGEYTAVSDQVRLVEDRDGDGRYDHSSIFSTGYDDAEEGAAAGVLWAGDRLLFTCIPSLWELRDADGDGQADKKRALLTGFGVHFALFGHDLHGLCHGPDGKIYFSIGDRGLNVETPGGPVVNTDSGAVLRTNPDGSGLELFATGLRNPQELAFNEYGDLFTVDNNSDAGDRARLVHVVEGMQAGWRMSYQYLPDRGPFDREKIWHTENDEQPASIVPPLAHITAGPSGLVRYPGTGMPADCDGSFFVCDFRGGSATSGVWQFWLEPHRASYRLANSTLFAVGVLATDCDFGPDGALYISDWVNGWNGTGTGRIHRVATDDAGAAARGLATRALLPQVAAMPVGELLPLLAHGDKRVRDAAQQRLVALGNAATEPLVEVAGNDDTALIPRLHAIWAIGQLGETDAALFDRLAELTVDEEPEIRAQVARTLSHAAAHDRSRWHTWGQTLVPLLADASPRVRAMAAITVGRLQHSAALPALLAMARENGDRDPVLRHATAMGLAGSQSPEALIAAAKSADAAERLAIVVALGRQKSPQVADFLHDAAARVELEVARIIWDAPLPEAYGPLAEMIDEAPTSEPLLRRALAANLAIGAPARLQAVIRCALRPDVAPTMRDHAWDLVRHWDAPSPRDPVHGQWRPRDPRPREEVVAALRAALPQILQAGDVGAPGLVVAAELGVSDAYAPLVAVLDVESLAPALRARAIAALSGADEALLIGAIDVALKSAAPQVRIAARQLLAQRFPARAVDELRRAAGDATLPERQAAIAALAQLDLPAAREAIGDWLSRVEDGSCPPGLMLDVLEAAAKSRDAAVVERRQAYADERSGKSPLAEFAASLEGGDAAVGQRIFEDNATLSCRRCHSRTSGEQFVGPNLADVGLRRSRSEILESIVAPNAKITEGFQTTALMLDTGKVVAGILRREDGQHAVLVDAEGNEIVVKLAEVEERSQGLSAMPENLARQMTPRDLRDLVEFLSTLRAAPDPDRELPPVGAPSPAAGHPAAGN